MHFVYLVYLLLNGASFETGASLWGIMMGGEALGQTCLYNVILVMPVRVIRT
jgi:hypothetical protein